jgi:hypothetical protein
MRTLSLVCVALILSATPVLAGRKSGAAATSQQSYWSGGVDDTSFYRDSYECIKENPVGSYRAHRYSSPENDKADQAARAEAVQAAKQMANLCMRARGYVLRGPDGTIIP